MMTVTEVQRDEIKSQIDTQLPKRVELQKGDTEGFIDLLEKTFIAFGEKAGDDEKVISASQTLVQTAVDDLMQFEGDLLTNRIKAWTLAADISTGIIGQQHTRDLQHFGASQETIAQVAKEMDRNGDKGGQIGQFVATLVETLQLNTSKELGGDVQHTVFTTANREMPDLRENIGAAITADDETGFIEKHGYTKDVEAALKDAAKFAEGIAFKNMNPLLAAQMLGEGLAFELRATAKEGAEGAVHREWIGRIYRAAVRAAAETLRNSGHAPNFDFGQLTDTSPWLQKVSDHPTLKSDILDEMIGVAQELQKALPYKPE